MKHFIDHFEEEENLKQMPEYKKLIRQYNDAGVVLMKFEINVQVEKYNKKTIKYNLYKRDCAPKRSNNVK